MCTLSDVFPSISAIKPFTPARYNYRELFRGQSLAFASRGNLPIAGWETEGPSRASLQQPASLLLASGPWHAQGWLGTRSGTPMHFESARNACLLQILSFLGCARATNAAPCTNLPADGTAKSHLHPPWDMSPQSRCYLAIARHSS